jgi:hypothetical protein
MSALEAFERHDFRAGWKSDKGGTMTFILWIIAVVLVVAGIVSIVRGGLLWGIVLIVLGLVVGPGGYSIFK